MNMVFTSPPSSSYKIEPNHKSNSKDTCPSRCRKSLKTTTKMATLSDSELLVSFDEHVIDELEAMQQQHANQPSFETTQQQQQQQQPAITCFFKHTKTGLKFTHEDDINLLKGYTERGVVDGIIARRFKKHKLPELKERLDELMQEIVREKLSSTPPPESPSTTTMVVVKSTEEDKFVEAMESFDAASKQETQRDGPSTPKRRRSPKTVDGAAYTDPKSRFKRQYRKSNEVGNAHATAAPKEHESIDEVPEAVITEMIPFVSDEIHSPPKKCILNSFANFELKTPPTFSGPEGAILSTSDDVRLALELSQIEQQKQKQKQKAQQKQTKQRQQRKPCRKAVVQAGTAKAAAEAVVASNPSIQLKFDYDPVKDVLADRFMVRSAFASINAMIAAKPVVPQALSPKTPAGHISLGCDEKLY